MKLIHYIKLIALGNECVYLRFWFTKVFISIKFCKLSMVATERRIHYFITLHHQKLAKITHPQRIKTTHNDQKIGHPHNYLK